VSDRRNPTDLRTLMLMLRGPLMDDPDNAISFSARVE
jgi:hypothetical protein